MKGCVVTSPGSTFYRNFLQLFLPGVEFGTVLAIYTYERLNMCVWRIGLSGALHMLYILEEKKDEWIRGHCARVIWVLSMAYYRGHLSDGIHSITCRHHPRNALTSDKATGTGDGILGSPSSEHRRGCNNPRRHLAQGTGTGYERIF